VGSIVPVGTMSEPIVAITNVFLAVSYAGMGWRTTSTRGCADRAFPRSAGSAVTSSTSRRDRLPDPRCLQCRLARRSRAAPARQAGR